MNPGIRLHLGQQIAMTPQLLQSIRMLQLSSLEMEQEVRQALENNLMLEPAEDADDTEDDAQDPVEAESAEHDDTRRTARRVHRDDARPQRRHRRCVPREHAEVTLGARHVHLIDLAGEEQLLGRDEFEMQGHG